MPVVSPIYNVLKKLVANNFAISNYKIKDIQQDIRNYFLIELDSPSLESIIQD